MVWGDVKGSVALLVQLHGLSAFDVALKRVDDCTLFGDAEGEQHWSDILVELTQDIDLIADRGPVDTVH